MMTDPEKNLLLWDCETKQTGDAKRPKTQDTKTQMGWYSGKDQGGVTAVVWRDKRDVCMLTDIHDPPSGGIFREEHGNAIKQAIVADYSRHIGYVHKADRMAKSYVASRRTWKWTKNSFSTCLT